MFTPERINYYKRLYIYLAGVIDARSTISMNNRGSVAFAIRVNNKEDVDFFKEMYGMEFKPLKKLNGVYEYREYSNFALLQRVKPFLVVRRLQVEYILKCVENKEKIDIDTVNSYNSGAKFRPQPPIVVTLTEDEFLIWLSAFIKYHANIKDEFIEINHLSRELLELIKDRLNLNVVIGKKSERNNYLRIKDREDIKRIKELVNSHGLT